MTVASKGGWGIIKIMNAKVEKAVEQIQSLTAEEREEFLEWLAEDEFSRLDDWDQEIERDSQPGGRLEVFLKKARKDIAEGRTQPLDEVLDNS